MLISDETNSSFAFINKWQKAIPDWCKQKYPSESRSKEYLSSREALQTILKDKGNKNLTLEQLEIVNHHHLKDLPEIKVSISHTKGSWGAAVTCSSEAILGVGVDLEHATRTIKPEITKLFVHEEDQYKSLLELWCFKEAAFKAISPLLNHEKFGKVLVLKDIVFKDNKFFLRSHETALGSVSPYYTNKDGQDFLLVTAFLRKEPN